MTSLSPLLRAREVQVRQPDEIRRVVTLSREWIDHHVEWLRVEVEQVVEPANLGVAKVIRAVRLRLLLPDVVDGWLPFRVAIPVCAVIMICSTFV